MQQWVRKAARDYGLAGDVASRYIDLTSEVGELGKEVLRATGYGRAPRALTEAFAEEVGDCLFSLLLVCEAAGIDAEAALHAALEKYAARWRQGGGIGSQGREG